MLMAEVVQCEFLIRNFVHRRAGIHLDVILQVSVVNDIGLIITELFAGAICLELFPPVQRSSDVKVDGDHPHELAMICAGISETGHEVEIILSNIKTASGTRCITAIMMNASHTISYQIFMTTPAIALLPRVLRVPHAANSVLPAKNFDIFNFQHLLLLSLMPHGALPSHKVSRSPHHRI